MDVKQIAPIINTITREVIGEEAVIVQEDLSNIVEVGQQILSNNNWYDNYVRILPDMVGRMVFVNRVYRGTAPDIAVDGWEFGSIMAKYNSSMPEAIETESWKLENGASYDQGIFYQPKAETKFFNGAVTYTIPQSIAKRQVKESFHGAYEMNAFFEMLYNEIDKSMTVKLDALKMRTINNLIAVTIADGVGTDYDTTSTRAVNLLALYNAEFSSDTPLTAAEAMTNKNFIRYAVYKMGDYKDMMKQMSTLFNIGGTQKFTPPEMLKTVLYSPFVRAAGVYLYDGEGQFRNENLGFGEFDSVPAWQAITSMDPTDRSTINVRTSEGDEVECSGILGIMFDRDAAVVCNQEREVEAAPYNAVGSFQNYYHKWKCSYLNDFNENAVVFFIHD